jgi:hypothetical protein
MFQLNRATRPTDCADASGPLWVEPCRSHVVLRTAAIGASRPLRRIPAIVSFLNPTAGTQPCRREPLFMPQSGRRGSLSRIGSAVLRRKRPLHDKFAHALHSSVHEREMICDRGSAVRGSMTSPDVRATSRAYVAGLERHKMEEWRTNAASGPRLGASSMTNRLYASLDERRGSGHS